MIHRYMPYKINHKTNDKAKANQSHILFDVLSELKQLQSFISTEQLNDCKLVEEDGETSKCVSIAPELEYLAYIRKYVLVKHPCLLAMLLTESHLKHL